MFEFNISFVTKQIVSIHNDRTIEIPLNITNLSSKHFFLLSLHSFLYELFKGKYYTCKLTLIQETCEHDVKRSLVSKRPDLFRPERFSLATSVLFWQLLSLQKAFHSHNNF